MSLILTGAASAIPGYSSVKFDLGKALSILHWFNAQGYHYTLDGKAEDIMKSPPVCRDYSEKGDPIVKGIDCSGFHRYVLYHATGGLVVPDGSSNQNDWYKAQGFKHNAITTAGSDYTANMNPSLLYSCFCRAGTRGEEIGHVWYVYNRYGQWHTLESHGGSGPDSRPAMAPILAHIVTDVYPISKPTYG